MLMTDNVFIDDIADAVQDEGADNLSDTAARVLASCLVNEATSLRRLYMYDFNEDRDCGDDIHDKEAFIAGVLELASLPDPVFNDDPRGFAIQFAPEHVDTWNEFVNMGGRPYVPDTTVVEDWLR